MAEIIKKSSKPTVKQKRIIESAITLFAEKGYSNTSTSEIAKMAEVAEGTIFKHYGTKENLLLSLMASFIKDFLPSMADELIEEIMNDAVSFEQFLKALIKNRVAFFLENKEIFQVFIKEVIYKEDLKNELLPYIFENVTSRLINIIELFQKRGELIQVPSMSILKMIGTFLAGFFISRFVLLDIQSIRDDEIDEMVSFVLNGIGQPSQ
ncbi:TetR/AcrR family transcriptional regulator [Paenibacillus sp. GCM10028914]